MPALTLSNLFDNENTLSEIQIQSRVYQYFYNHYPEIRGMFVSIPNEGSRTKLETMQLIAAGLTPGFSDMLLYVHSTLFLIEVKTLTGTLRPNQKAHHELWRSRGVNTYVCYGVRELYGVVLSILENRMDITQTLPVIPEVIS